MRIGNFLKTRRLQLHRKADAMQIQSKENERAKVLTPTERKGIRTGGLAAGKKEQPHGKWDTELAF